MARFFAVLFLLFCLWSRLDDGERQAEALETATLQDFFGTWNWVDTTTTGGQFNGIATIGPMLGGVSWAWADDSAGRWAAPICFAGGSCPAGPSISGTSIVIPGYTNDRSMSATWSGTLSSDGQAIEGTWPQSDGQSGTFVAARLAFAGSLQSDNQWKYSRSVLTGWEEPAYDDSAWGYTVEGSGACGPYAGMMWPPNPVQNETVFVRRTVVLANAPTRAIYAGGFDDDGLVYVNGTLVHTDDDNWSTGFRAFDITHLLHAGSNVLAMRASDDIGGCQSIYARFAWAGDQPLPVHRKILFIQGIHSQASCSDTNDGFEDRVAWMRNMLSADLRIAQEVGSLSFHYFDYSPDEEPCDPNSNYGQPSYEPSDTCGRGAGASINTWTGSRARSTPLQRTARR